MAVSTDAKLRGALKHALESYNKALLVAKERYAAYLVELERGGDVDESIPHISRTTSLQCYAAWALTRYRTKRRFPKAVFGTL